jgi:TP901 family phage tail tape measure protein
LSQQTPFFIANFTENQYLMAKTISDEQMKLSIIINGNSAQKELFDLEKSTRSLTEENKALGLQKKLLIKQGKEETTEYKNLTATIKANNAEITDNKNKMKLLQDQIGLTGLTMAQLQGKAAMLRNTLRNLVPGSEDYIRYQAELSSVNSRLGELSGRSRTAQSSMGSLADTFNRYQGMALAAVAALTGMALSIQKIIDINGKLSDSQSDVMKTTGMTKEEVDDLTKSFGLLQTRSSRIDLLGIAEQGGRIGIAKEEIGDFVNVMNKASVSLGDSFSGGAEEVANKLGKIKFLFEQTKDLGVDESYNSIGSAINDLGANGVASEANIADFTTRIGSLTDVLKPTIQETLALGAAFEESGIESEVSARAYGIFMKQASTESGKFAKVMGISQKSVEDMINTNPLDFMLKFSEGMKGMSATETAKTLDSLGISADGANKVIGAMGNNTARFRELIDLSNASFASGTSLINEYNIKNNNLAATLEKISKRVSGWFSSETFIKWLEGAVEWIAKFIGATEDADGNVTAWKNTLIFTSKVLAIVTAAMITNVGWQKLVALWTTRSAEANFLYVVGAKARAFADGVGAVATQAYAIATMLMRGNLVGATQAFRVMTAAMMTTPWGFIIGAIAAIGTAYVLFSKNANDAALVQKTLADVHLEATKNIAKEKAEVDLLTKIVNSETVSKDKKLKAIERLNEIIPDYIGHLSLENIKTAEGIGILQKYTAELYANARAKAVQSKFDELAKEKVDIESKSGKDYKSGIGSFMAKITGQEGSPEFQNKKDIERYVMKNFSGQLNSSKDKNTGATLVNKKMFETLVNQYMEQSGLADKEKELALKDAEMKVLEGELLKSTVHDLGKPTEGNKASGSSFNVAGGKSDSKGGSKKDNTKTQEEINKERLDAQLKFNELSVKNTRQLEDDKLSAMEEGYDKEIAIETLRYKRDIEDLQKQKVHGDEIAKLDVDIAKAKKDKDAKYYNFLLGLKKDWSDKNETLDKQINAIALGKLATHNLKVATIQEKGAKEAIVKSKEVFDQAKILRETKFNEQLAALGKNEKAKEKLRKSFALSELAEEEKFLKELVDQFNLIVGKGNFGKMDMSLLTPEQVESFTNEAAKVGLTLSELIAKKNELTGKEAGADATALGISKSNTDIFGFTPENWVELSNNLANGKLGINEMVFAVSALTDAYSKYNDFLTANENAQLKKYTATSDAKKNKLRKQLDSGMISQAVYNKKVEKIDEDLDNKKADLEYKQAKRQRMISAANIIMSTAQAIIGIWAQFPKMDFGITAGIMSGVVGALGAMQLATVLATPLPAKGHETGLYPEYVKREQDGKVFKSSYQGKTRSGLVSNTSHFLVAENGPEMVIDNKAWTQMDPAVKDALVRDLRGIKGFEQGYYNQDLKRYEVPTASSSSSTPSSSSSNNDQMMQMMMAVVSENTAVMKDLRDRGVVGKFFKNDLQSAKNIQDSINDFNDLRTKAKK